MHEYHQNRYDDRQQGCRWGAVVAELKGGHQNRIETNAHDRCQRHVFGTEHDDGENPEQDQKDDGVKQQDDHAGSGNALAAPEPEEAGKHMSDYHKQASHSSAGLVPEYTDEASCLVVRNCLIVDEQVAEYDSQRRLEHITHQRKSGGFRSVGAEHVSCARVAAAVYADVIMVLASGNNQPEIEAAQEVWNDHTK